MKFLVKEIFFDVDDEDITLEEYNEIVQDSLGVWEADNEDDLLEEITCNSGWCIKSIDYDMWDYVSEWQDLEGVNLDRLLDIHKTLVISKYTKQVYQGA